MNKQQETNQLARIVANFYKMTDVDRDAMEAFSDLSVQQNPRQEEKTLRLVVGATRSSKAA